METDTPQDPMKTAAPMEQDDLNVAINNTDGTVNLDTIDTDNDLFNLFREQQQRFGRPINENLETQPETDKTDRVFKKKDPRLMKLRLQEKWRLVLSREVTLRYHTVVHNFPRSNSKAVKSCSYMDHFTRPL